MGFSRIRIDAHRLTELRDRLLRLSLRTENLAKVVVGFAEIGLESERFAVLSDRVVQPSFRPQHVGKIVMCVGKIWLRPEGGPVMVDRLVHLPEFLQHDTEIVVRRGMPCVVLERGAILADCLQRLTAVAQRIAQLVIGPDVARILLDRVTIERLLQQQGVFAVSREQLKLEVRHLVGRSETGDNPPRRPVRIANVVAGIVVAVPHADDRPSGKGNRRRVSINILPLEVPLVDPQQLLFASVWQLRHPLHRFGQEMGMRVDRQNLDVDRQLEAIGHDKVFVARSNVNRVIGIQSHQVHGRSDGSRLGKIESDDGVDGLRFPRRNEVKLKHQVIAGFETPRFVLHARKRRHPGRPPEKVPVRRLGIAHIHAVETGLTVAFIASARRSS